MEKIVRVGGLRLRVVRRGPRGRMPVVLAHGISDDAGCWGELGAVLAEDHDVVMVDARGHGRSDAPRLGYGAAEQVRDLVGVIAGLDLQHPAVLGHSMGATTALVLAAMHPQLPRAVVLEDPPAWWTHAGPPTELQRARNRSMQRTLAALKRRTAEELASIQREAAPDWSDDAIRSWVDATLRLSPAVVEQLPAMLEANAALHWPALLSAVRCPVLLLTGDPERGAIVTRPAAAALQALVDHVEVVHLPGAGHTLRREQPEAVIEAVRGFV